MLQHRLTLGFFAAVLLYALLGIVEAVIPQLPPATPEPGYTLPARITSVYDGDTLVVEFKPQTARIRLLDCWSPEITGSEKPQGLKSKANLEKLIAPSKGECVVVIPWQTNVGNMTTMSRVLGRVITADGIDVSKAQVEQGFATPTKFSSR